MNNRATDGEKGTGKRKHGQSFFVEGAELTFSTACRCLHFFNTPSWAIPFEYQRRDGDSQQGSCGYRLINTKDLVACESAALSQSFFRQFTEHARHLGWLLSECFPSILFFKKTKTQRVCMNERTSE